VRVYAGVDPVSKKNYLVETVPAGPKAAREAEKVRTRLLNQVDEKRNPRTNATVNQLMDRYMELLDVEPTTRGTYDGYIRNHIRPLLGELGVGRLDGETLDSFYAVLRACRAHCRGRKYTKHRTDGEHECDGRCRPHACRPLADSSVRRIHGILSGACKRAVRWRWLGTNPIAQAESPSPARPGPRPPTPDQTAQIATAAWRDLDWGMLVWLALMTDARRGELCALRWDQLDFATGVLTIRSSTAQSGAKNREKDTKTHQQRRITLDDQTFALLRAYLRRCQERACAGPRLRTAGRGADVLALARRRHVAEAGLGRAAVGANVRPPGLGREHSPAPALLGYRTARRGRRRADRGRTSGPRRRIDNAPGLQRLGVRGGPASRRHPHGAHAASP
jgi:integrase